MGRRPVPRSVLRCVGEFITRPRSQMHPRLCIEHLQNESRSAPRGRSDRRAEANPTHREAQLEPKIERVWPGRKVAAESRAADPAGSRNRNALSLRP